MRFATAITSATLAALSLAAPTAKRAVSNLYTLTAHAPGNSAIDGLPINAMGTYFFIGGSPVTYCPSTVVSDCPSETNTTVFGPSVLWVEAPGGQQTYTQSDGTWAFEQPDSILEIDYIGPGGGAQSDGFFVGYNNSGLVACPSTAEPESPYLQIFFEIDGFNYTENCTCFVATATNWTGGFGAWEYL